ISDRSGGPCGRVRRSSDYRGEPPLPEPARATRRRGRPRGDAASGSRLHGHRRRGGRAPAPAGGIAIARIERDEGLTGRCDMATMTEAQKTATEAQRKQPSGQQPAGDGGTPPESQPLLRQRGEEIQPYGALTRYPLGLSDDVRAASVKA